MALGQGVQVLEEPERTPSEEEIVEYAEFLGIDVDNESELMWIAREGVTAPVPAPWKACTENGDDVFYFNFETAESVWDHPCDEKYREMVEKHREALVAKKKLKSDAQPDKTSEKATNGPLEPKDKSSEAAGPDTAAGGTNGEQRGLTRQEVVLPRDKDTGDANVNETDANSARLSLIRAEISEDSISDASEGKVDVDGGTSQEPDGKSTSLVAERSVATDQTRLGTSKDALVSPSKGLAGVGLGLSPAAQVDTQPDDALDASDTPSSPSSRGNGKRNSPDVKPLASGLSRPAVAHLELQLEQSGQSGLSEISEDFPSAFESGSPNHGADDTLELSATMLTEPVEPATGDAGAASKLESGGRADAASSCLSRRYWQDVEAEVDSLTRCLAMLRDIREKQLEYARLLERSA